MGAVIIKIVPTVKKVRAMHMTTPGRTLPRSQPATIAAMAPEMQTGEIWVLVLAFFVVWGCSGDGGSVCTHAVARIGLIPRKISSYCHM